MRVGDDEGDVEACEHPREIVGIGHDAHRCDEDAVAEAGQVAERRFDAVGGEDEHAWRRRDCVKGGRDAADACLRLCIGQATLLGEGFEVDVVAAFLDPVVDEVADRVVQSCAEGGGIVGPASACRVVVECGEHVGVGAPLQVPAPGRGVDGFPGGGAEQGVCRGDSGAGTGGVVPKDGNVEVRHILSTYDDHAGSARSHMLEFIISRL